ncbi:hypothetical protein HNQ93_001583 [Hymenobacter luteus]|uniref:Uncharacterized protein n=2 Tax=Hymenobacter TaxID=89966 RepID=A0A7W9SZE3_9BACT|nr:MULTISPECIES: hypothetical protein [Hymenobacter]MBB4601056.1 hypothetical protein [Hymenobacter latericoloratus]MBB6058737.1 hypothetical protein [Hymenobacter luteus]
MTVPQFSQYQFLRGSTQLLLRQHGLHVSQRSRRGAAWLETEIPYEELLPVELEYASPPPLRTEFFWILAWLIAQAALHLTQNRQDTAALLVGGLGFVLGLGVVVLVRRRRARTVTLGTNRLRVVLRNRRSQRAVLEAFTEELRLRAHGYLREEYGQINPLGPIELQLHRLRWLHQLRVLSNEELQTLSTRLTGRLSLAPLNLMGQELETPYVN